MFRVKKFISMLVVCSLILCLLPAGKVSAEYTRDFGQIYVDEEVVLSVESTETVRFTFIPDRTGVYVFCALDCQTDARGWATDADGNMLTEFNEETVNSQFKVEVELRANETYYFYSAREESYNGAYSVMMLFGYATDGGTESGGGEDSSDGADSGGTAPGESLPDDETTPGENYADIWLIQEPSKTVYEYGEALDTTGMIIGVRIQDGHEIAITEGFTVEGYDPCLEGQQEIFVCYAHDVCSFFVTVLPEESVDPVDPVDPNPGIPSDATMTIESAVVHTSQEQVQLVFTLEDLPAVQSLGIKDITFDEDLFAISSGVWTLPSEPRMANNYGENANGVYTATALFEEDTDCNGAFFVLTLDILSETVNQVTSVSCEFSALTSEGAVDVEVIDGTVQLISVVRGDIDGNGVVNKEDATYMLNHLLFSEDFPLFGEDNGDTDLDYNGDSQVTSDDVVYLLDFISSPEQYPLS